MGNDCMILETEVNNLLEESNYCTVDEDCKVKSYSCPFGCWKLLNKNVDLTNVEQKMSEYWQNCERCKDDCYKGDMGGIKCVDNRCVEVAEEVIDKEYDWEARCIQSGGNIEEVCTDSFPSHCINFCSCDNRGFVSVINQRTGEYIEKAFKARILKDNQCFDCSTDVECSDQTKGYWCQEGYCYKSF